MGSMPAASARTGQSQLLSGIMPAGGPALEKLKQEAGARKAVSIMLMCIVFRHLPDRRLVSAAFKHQVACDSSLIVPLQLKMIIALQVSSQKLMLMRCCRPPGGAAAGLTARD